MGAGGRRSCQRSLALEVLHTGTDEAARTHGEVRNAPVSKHAHTPASAAAGIEHAIRMLEGRWKLVILFHLFGGKTLRFSDLERAISWHLPEDADPTAPRTTVAPRSARYRAVASPRPLLAPVMTTTLPVMAVSVCVVTSPLRSACGRARRSTSGSDRRSAGCSCPA